jgi:hypothetical protein
MGLPSFKLQNKQGDFDGLLVSTSIQPALKAAGATRPLSRFFRVASASCRGAGPILVSQAADVQ